MSINQWLEEAQKKQELSLEEMQKEQEELKQLSLLYGMDFAVYTKILPLTKLASEKEQRTLPPSEQLRGARLHAAKLAILFGDVENAVQYLKRYEEQYPDSQQLIHDACLLSLPEGNQWDVTFWRGMISKQNPSRPDDLIMRFLSFANKIEVYLKENRTTLENEIREKITGEYQEKFSHEYDTKLKDKEKNSDKDSEQIKTDAIEIKLASQNKSIQTETKKKFDSYLRSELGLSERGKLEDKDRDNLAARKKSPTDSDKKNLKKIKVDVIQEYRKKGETSYKLGLSAAIESKDAYVQHQLKELAGEIKQKIKHKTANVLTKNTSLKDISVYSRHALYQNAEKNLEAAELFFYHGISEEHFNEYLALKPQDDPKQIPNITIKGEQINPKYAGYYLKKLQPSDPRAAVLGKLTSCCQSIGDTGSSSAKHGITNQRGGFYVLCKKTKNQPETILAQCWAWRSQAGAMVFDSVESQIDFRNKSIPQTISDFYTCLAAELVQKYKVPRVLVGSGGATPAKLGVLRPILTSNPFDYAGYSDAKQQRLIADKELPLIHVYNHLNPESQPILPSTVHAMSREALLEWCDLLVINNQEEFIKYVEPFIDKAGLKERDINERIQLTTEWIRYLADLADLSEANKNFTFALVSSFIDKGVNLNIPNRYGTTVLHGAVRNDKWDVVVLLVEKGADINAKDNYEGSTVLHRAACGGKWDVMKWLVEKGADINAKDRFRRTVLHEAARISNWDDVKWLVEKGADGSTVLHRAVRSGHGKLDVVQWLVENGADINIKNKDGKIAKDTVAGNGNKKLKDFLDAAMQLQKPAVTLSFFQPKPLETEQSSGSDNPSKKPSLK